MITMGSSFTYKYKYRQGTGSNFNDITLTWSMPGWTIGQLIYSWTPQNNPALNCVLFAYSDEPFGSGGRPLHYEGVATGAHPATAAGNTANMFAASYSIDSVTSQESIPRIITNAYNSLFGTFLTNAQVYEKLKELYGDHECFVFYVGGGTGWVPYIGSNSYNYNFYQDPASTEIGVDKCTNYAGGVSISSLWENCFTGETRDIEDDYIQPTASDSSILAAYFIFTKTAPDEKLRFNVYVDGVIGEKGPNVAITWTNTNEDSELSPILIQPHIWAYPCAYFNEGTASLSPRVGWDVQKINDIISPRPSLNINNTYNWNSEGFQGDYIGMANTLTADQTDLEKTVNYGLDGIPEYIRIFMRFDYTGALNGQTVHEWGDLWYVNIPYNYEGAAYIEPQKVDESIFQPGPAFYDTEVIVIGGTPPEDDVPLDPDEPEQGYDDEGDYGPDGPYADPEDNPDLTPYDSEGYPGQAVLTKTYAVTSARLQNLGNKLWTQSYFDVLKVQSNPIENIISVKWFPMSLSGTEEDIVVGDVNMGVRGEKISTIYKKTIGSFKYTGMDPAPGYLSQSPYTILKLHLPYVGVIQLDASEIFNHTMTIQYVVDLVSGDLVVFIKLDGNPYMNVSGKMGVDIPLSASDRAQVQISSASRALSAMAGAAGATLSGNYVGAAESVASGAMSIMGSDYSTQRVQTHSPVCASFENRAIVLEIIYPKTYISAGYAHLHGYPSHQYTRLTKGMGFVKTSPRTVIDVAMTEEENRDLERILAGGCYF